VSERCACWRLATKRTQNKLENIFTKKVRDDAGCQRTSRELDNLGAADTAC
jgi:hypothetical protein